MPLHATETAGSIAADTDTNIKAVTIRIAGGAEIITTIGEIPRIDTNPHGNWERLKFGEGVFVTKFGTFIAALVSCIAASMVGAAAQVAPVVPPTPVAPMSPTTPDNSPSMASNPNNVADPMVTKDPNKIICVKEKLTGSMLPSTVCQTRRAWIRMGVDSRDIIDHAQRVGSGQPGGG